VKNNAHSIQQSVYWTRPSGPDERNVIERAPYRTELPVFSLASDTTSDPISSDLKE
jgi:hypothetical protein